jgi:hypothetical protein
MASSATKAGQFNDLNTKMIYSPKTSEGKGFLPPLLRAIGHLLYALGIADDDLPKKATTAADKKTAAEVITMVKEEITSSIKHFEKVEISDNFSTIAKDQLVVFNQALNALAKEFDGWDRDTQINNLTSLVNKVMGISAMLDRELIGLRDSDPGSSL